MSVHTAKLILASASPRRRQLLAERGYEFDVCPPVVDDEPRLADGEGPRELVCRLARQKAADVARRLHEGVILACDTVVDCDGRILGKPADAADAGAMLRALSGREHRVISGVCLWPLPEGTLSLADAETVLRMDRLSEQEIDAYVASGAWQGKAGGFGYQDQLGWVHIIHGSPSNVVGLPMELVEAMLTQYNIRPRWTSVSSK